MLRCGGAVCLRLKLSARADVLGERARRAAGGLVNAAPQHGGASAADTIPKLFMFLLPTRFLSFCSVC